MSKNLKLVFQIISTLVFVGLLIPFYFYIRHNEVSAQNTLIRKAKNDYYQREFLSAYKTYERLLDSMNFNDERARMNYGNAAFMSSAILKSGFYGSTRQNSPEIPDSVLQQLAVKSQDAYILLTTSEDRKLASQAYNQIGYSAIKSQFGKEGSDSILYQALFNFKQALKEDPRNDSARYNYELIKKIISFPETTMAATNALISQRRYVEAAELLERNMARDIRLKDQQEFLKRLKSVAGIDTTFKKK
jgi:tetratricopeptide (TPR) repeat protein